jgi:predicted methyltransferase
MSYISSSIERAILGAVLVGIVAGHLPVQAAETSTDAIPVSPAVAQAAADRFRATELKIDAVRRGAEIVQFTHARSGDVIVDFVPGGGYFTRLFSPLAGPSGQVYALWPKEYATQARNVDKMRAMAAQPHYANVKVLVQPIAEMRAPVPVDIVFTSMNYHDVPLEEMSFTDPAILDRQVFAMLKPGGYYIVFDHVATPGSGLRDTGELHRIDPILVRRQVEAAGFVLDEESMAFRNPDDPHTGVSFEGPLRGNTDRFLFRFRKPDALAREHADMH